MNPSHVSTHEMTNSSNLWKLVIRSRRFVVDREKNLLKRNLVRVVDRERGFLGVSLTVRHLKILCQNLSTKIIISHACWAHQVHAKWVVKVSLFHTMTRSNLAVPLFLSNVLTQRNYYFLITIDSLWSYVQRSRYSSPPVGSAKKRDKLRTKNRLSRYFSRVSRWWKC